MTENDDDTLSGVSEVNSFSDFPSNNYANFYSTKRKSAKNASDLSLKLIIYIRRSLHLIFGFAVTGMIPSRYYQHTHLFAP